MISLAGHLQLHAAARANGRTALVQQSFRAPFHLSKPYWDPDAKALCVQVVNPTAGILAGDRLESRITLGPGAALSVTTPSASRVFTMDSAAAECRQDFAVGADAWLEVSPEPLVPHRRSRFRQATRIEIAPGGGLFFVDQLIPGRLGHGEAWAWSELGLELEVRIGGELILRERFAHSGGQLRCLAEFGGAGDTACFANAVLVPPGANADAPWREAVAALHGDGTWVGVSSLRRTGWSLKVVARDPLRLRQAMRDIRRILADHLPPLRADLRKL